VKRFILLFTLVGFVLGTGLTQMHAAPPSSQATAHAKSKHAGQAKQGKKGAEHKAGKKTGKKKK
jgi:hypothetical protein